MRDLSLTIFKEASRHAASKGFILADTKFEFGTLDNKTILIDEVLTPDSSRFWEKDKYAPGRAQEAFDKQFVRDYLEKIQWNKQAPSPGLPDDIVQKTRQKYIEAYERLTGKNLMVKKTKTAKTRRLFKRPRKEAETAPWLIEVAYRSQRYDPAGSALAKSIRDLDPKAIRKPRVSQLYILNGALAKKDAESPLPNFWKTPFSRQAKSNR